MNKNAELWIKELETTEEKQCSGKLGGPTIGYCCLGIGCLIYERETRNTLPRFDSGEFTNSVLNVEFSVVRDWLGLQFFNGDCNDPDKSIAENSKFCLSYLNDKGGKSFKEIAEIIKANPENYFTKGE